MPDAKAVGNGDYRQLLGLQSGRGLQGVALTLAGQRLPGTYCNLEDARGDLLLHLAFRTPNRLEVNTRFGGRWGKGRVIATGPGPASAPCHVYLHGQAAHVEVFMDGVAVYAAEVRSRDVSTVTGQGPWRVLGQPQAVPVHDDVILAAEVSGPVGEYELVAGAGVTLEAMLMAGGSSGAVVVLAPTPAAQASALQLLRVYGVPSARVLPVLLAADVGDRPELIAIQCASPDRARVIAAVRACAPEELPWPVRSTCRMDLIAALGTPSRVWLGPEFSGDAARGWSHDAEVYVAAPLTDDLAKQLVAARVTHVIIGAKQDAEWPSPRGAVRLAARGLERLAMSEGLRNSDLSLLAYGVPGTLSTASG